MTSGRVRVDSVSVLLTGVTDDTTARMELMNMSAVSICTCIHTSVFEIDGRRKTDKYTIASSFRAYKIPI